MKEPDRDASIENPSTHHAEQFQPQKKLTRAPPSNIIPDLAAMPHSYGE